MTRITLLEGSNKKVLEGNGNSKAISRSNKRNNMATRKNRKEKGIRAEFRGSKPHSYGEAFSESVFRWGRKWARKVISLVIIIIDIEVIINLKILLVIYNKVIIIKGRNGRWGCI